jgi:hypothetical protein
MTTTVWRLDPPGGASRRSERTRAALAANERDEREDDGERHKPGERSEERDFHQ